jgi:anion-transporting  ArsA/GET3 family ATPase
LTIDPARRLAQSLGLTELDNDPRVVHDVVDPENGGRLEAMMLDMKRTFDEFVEAHSDAERAAQILANPFYQTLSSSFAGTQEYMAMEKLGQLYRRSSAVDTWDLIVVDTPPSRSALDFLDAPQRLGTFLDSRLMRVLAAPAKSGGKVAMRFVTAGLGIFAGALKRILGSSLLEDLATFVSVFDTVFGGFQARAEQTYSLLKEPVTRFVVVAAPEADALREAAYFVNRLASDDMPLAGLVLNRVEPNPIPGLTVQAALEAAERIAADDPITAGLLQLHADVARTRKRQGHLAERFTAAHPNVAIAEVPTQAGDVHDAEGLRAVGLGLAGL